MSYLIHIKIITYDLITYVNSPHIQDIYIIYYTPYPKEDIIAEYYDIKT
nr:MAG TPA: hypothetical protein [Caudoviricetes sp.]